MSWYKSSNGRITERKLQNNVRSPSYDNYDSLVILVSPSPLQCCLPASPTIFVTKNFHCPNKHRNITKLNLLHPFILTFAHLARESSFVSVSSRRRNSFCSSLKASEGKGGGWSNCKSAKTKEAPSNKNVNRNREFILGRVLCCLWSSQSYLL